MQLKCGINLLFTQVCLKNVMLFVLHLSTLFHLISFDFSDVVSVLKSYAVFNKNLKMFQCTICNKQCAQKSNMLRHIESIHFPNTFTYTCEYCNATLPTRKKKEHHLAKFHRDRKDYATVL